MYFCETINYQLSDLKAVDRHLLPLVKALIHYSVSKVWIEEFRDFLIRRQQLFLEKNRRAKQVDISTSFHCVWPHDASVQGHHDSACLRCGTIYVRFVWIKEDLHAFDAPSTFIDTINSIINTSEQ